MKKLKKGDNIHLCSNLFNKNEIIETKIKSIGPKYITVEGSDLKFYRNTLRECCSRGLASFLIEDIEEYNVEKLYSEIISKLERFEWNKLNRKDLNIINVILEKYQ